MEICVDIEKYNPEEGLKYSWTDGFTIEVKIDNEEVMILANREGLISLATQLLTLAQSEVPSSSHFHYGENCPLEEGSIDFTIEKK